MLDTHQPFYILLVLVLLIFISEWLSKNTILKHLSSALMVIILGAVVANLGLIPSASDSSPVYDAIFKYVAPASIFYLLLGVRLSALKKAGIPMLVAFLIGSAGTVIGVVISLQLIDYKLIFGENYAAIAGMMTGTYTGGSVNFNAVALNYEVYREGAVFTGLVVADNIVTAIWMVITLSWPAVMNRIRPNKEMLTSGNDQEDGLNENENLNPKGLSLMLLLGMGVIYASNVLSKAMDIPSVLILTTLALLLAQLPVVQRMAGAKLFGMFSVYLFLAVVGAFCELSALAEVGEHAFSIVLFTVVIVFVHGLVLLGCGLLFRLDWSIVAVASQANIGGASTALALAKSVKRSDLILPAILAGSLGTALGTYLGFLVAGFL